MPLIQRFTIDFAFLTLLFPLTAAFAQQLGDPDFSPAVGQAAFPGAVEEMAARFGIVMGNGFAFTADGSGLMQFRRADGSLQSHPITEGCNLSETVPFVTSFTGQAFRPSQTSTLTHS